MFAQRAWRHPVSADEIKPYLRSYEEERKLGEKVFDAYQVALEEIAASTPIQVADGQHRRNIITRGISLEALQGKRFSVGKAVLEYDRPRPPCGYIQGLTQRGMTKALGGSRGGICATVVESGAIRISDIIQLLT